MNFEKIRNEFNDTFIRFVDEYYATVNPLSEVVSYVLKGTGKRTRAILTLLSAEALGAKPQSAMIAATAVEMVHAYSLIHDDLPCMDNDDLRRGRPTAHVKFGEAEALLAGDAILSDAFLVLSDPDFPSLWHFPVAQGIRARLVAELTRASGSRAMVGGQMLDIHWTKRRDGTLADLSQIHELKTGALIGASCAMGGLCSERASRDDLECLRRAGILVGHAFQILDDLLDDDVASGKSVGKDRFLEKLCYLKLMSPKAARDQAKAYTEEAMNLLSKFGQDGQNLREFMLALLARRK